MVHPLASTLQALKNNVDVMRNRRAEAIGAAENCQFAGKEGLFEHLRDFYGWFIYIYRESRRARIAGDITNAEAGAIQREASALQEGIDNELVETIEKHCKCTIR